MCYFKTVINVLKNHKMKKWASDYHNYHINDYQRIQLMAWLDEYNPIFLEEKGLFIEIPLLPNGNLNLFIDTRNQKACEKFSTELICKLAKSHSNRVMLFTQEWVKTVYYQPMKKFIGKHRNIIQAKYQTDYTVFLLEDNDQVKTKTCEVA
jgi:hypothetical protein